jgi:signal transduction histidine kinase
MGSEHVNPFRPPITAIRWGALAVGMGLAGANLSGLEPRVLVAGLLLVAYAGWRTIHPLSLDRDAPRGAIAVEAAVHIAAVAATGYWASPFVLSLVTAVLVVGFARSFAAALRASLLSAIAVAVPYHLTSPSLSFSGATLSAQWTTTLVLVAVVAGYARRFSIEVAERHERDLDRLDRLAHANALLHSLHDVAQALPSSLDIDEALDSVMASLRAFYDLTTAAVMLPDESGPAWTVARQQGSRLAVHLDRESLPAAAARTIDLPARSRRLDLEGGCGLTERSRSGLYAPLHARGELVAIVAVEHDEPGRFSARDVEVLDGFLEGAALAIDNARRFGRLRRSSADEERSRIAGELHDHVGQSLACMAFEIDLLVRHRGDDELRSGLEGLRRDLRSVITEIRDTLSDLRADVTEDRGLVEVTEAFLDRVSQRSGRKALFHHGLNERLPILHERAMWRILYETVNQALRRGDCTVEVWWASDGSGAELEITTDVDGFDLAGEAPPDQTWVEGLRGQAASIGAMVDLETPADGTHLFRCSLRSSL